MVIERIGRKVVGDLVRVGEEGEMGGGLGRRYLEWEGVGRGGGLVMGVRG